MKTTSSSTGGPENTFDRRSLAILASAVLWGCFWIPLRQIDERSGGSILLTGSGFLLPLLVLLPQLLRNPMRIFSWGPNIWFMGLAFGIAGSFYAEGALRGNVARVILLFYLTPVWSTLLARIFLSEPITLRRLLTLCLGLLGMYVILGADNAMPIPQNMSEWFGLIAGIAWGISMVCLQKVKEAPLMDLALSIFLFYGLIFMLLSLIPGGRHWGLDTELLVPTTLLWVLALAFVWNFPAALLTLYGAVEVEPGKVAILLMLEVIIGISTAAWLTNEPFGLIEFVGAILIIGAGVVEFIPIPTVFRNKVNLRD